MATRLESGKTKIARRVIEVFEFFEHRRSATVMDIVRSCGRPQSSTSELLTSLVEMGFLYKDARARSYSPTPRLAMLGTAAQPQMLRDGSLFAFMERLAASTRSAMALFGIVGTHVQAFHVVGAPQEGEASLERGLSETLSASAAGLLLLSTMEHEQVRRILWRLNAEVGAAAKFDLREVGDHVDRLRREGHATGPVGFGRDAQVSAVLLPRAPDERPLAIGLVHRPGTPIAGQALIDTIESGIARCAGGGDDGAVPAPLIRAI